MYKILVNEKILKHCNNEIKDFRDLIEKLEILNNYFIHL